MKRNVAFLPVALAVCIAAMPRARAAVMVCQPVVEGEFRSSPDRLAARRQALASWTERTTALHGVSHVRWQNAFNRRIDCSTAPDATWRCQAHAEPCTPAYRIPADATPLKRGVSPS